MGARGGCNRRARLDHLPAGNKLAWGAWRVGGWRVCGGATGVPDWINVGGEWFNTPSAGECKGTNRPGDGTGCTWTLHGQPAPK